MKKLIMLLLVIGFVTVASTPAHAGKSVSNKQGSSQK